MEEERASEQPSKGKGGAAATGQECCRSERTWPGLTLVIPFRSHSCCACCSSRLVTGCSYCIQQTTITTSDRRTIPHRKTPSKNQRVKHHLWWQPTVTHWHVCRNKTGTVHCYSLLANMVERPPTEPKHTTSAEECRLVALLGQPWLGQIRLGHSMVCCSCCRIVGVTYWSSSQ